MTYQSIIPLLAAVCNLMLVVFVVSRPLRREVKGAFALWGGAIIFWSIGQYFLVTLPIFEVHTALMWARVMYLGILFLPVTLVHLSLCIVQVEMPRFLRAMYWLHGGFALANTTPLFVEGVWYSVERGMWFVVPGPVFWMWAFSYGIVFLAILLLLQRRRNLTPIHRNRLDLLIAAQVLLVAAGTHDLLPAMGILTYPFTGVPVLPLGSPAALIYGVFVAYSLLQHQLLDVQVVLSQVAAKVVRLGFVWLGSLVLLVLVGWLAPDGWFPPFAFLAALMVIIVTTTAASIFFPKLFGEGYGRIERRLLGDRFEYHDRISAFLNRIPAFRSQSQLLEELDDLLTGGVGIAKHAVLLKDEQGEMFLPAKTPAELSPMGGDAPVVRFFEGSDSAHLGLALRYTIPARAPAEAAARESMQGSGMELAFAFRASNRAIGLLFLGPKQNADPYTPGDLEVLTELVHSLSLFINHTRLENQLLLSEEMDLLGRMSQGIAHDLNNLLTPVSTYFQLLEEDGDSAALREELLPAASRNLATVRSYIRESLFFSDTRTLKLQPVPVAQLLHECVDLAHTPLREKRISVVVQAAEDLRIAADFILLKRAIGNLLSNAIHACTEAGIIEISATRLAPQEEGTKPVCRIDIQDNGHGMSQEHLKKNRQRLFHHQGYGRRGSRIRAGTGHLPQSGTPPWRKNPVFQQRRLGNSRPPRNSL